MSKSADSLSLQRSAGQRCLDAPALIVIAAVSFNALLAIVSSHVVRLSPEAVILAEVSLLSAAHILALLKYRSEMAPWYLLLGLLFLLFLGRSLVTGHAEPKFIRDVVIIPTFIILGIASNSGQLDRTISIILIIVVVMGLVEAIFPQIYANTFNIKDYYEQTRGYTSEDFFNKNSSLFVSATRPQTRMFEFVDMPRLSSIFLEPVSLGNYCTIMVAYFCARFSSLSKLAVFTGILAVTFLIIGCDGRLASVSAVLIIAICILAPYMPPFSGALYLPVVLIAALIVIPFLNPDAGADDFSGRVAFSLDLLSQFTLPDLLGYSDKFLEKAVDSGIAYLILTQSLIGTVLIWFFIACLSTQKNEEQVRYTLSLLLYMALAMMVSYSTLTIKTASIAWFIHGVLQQRCPSSSLSSQRSNEDANSIVRLSPSSLRGRG